MAKSEFHIAEGVGRRIAPAPIPTVAISFALSHADALKHEEDEVLDGAESTDDFIGQAYHLTYRDSKGTVSERRVIIREIRVKAHTLSIWAFCHERQRDRLFRVDRIAQMIDLHTGEILDAVDWCRARARDDDTQSALRELRQELAVLIYVARIDGQFHPQENAVIVEHVLDRRDYDPALDQERLALEIGRMRADTYLFETGIDSIMRMGDARLRQIERSIRRVVDADGILHDREHFILENLADIIDDRRQQLGR